MLRGQQNFSTLFPEEPPIPTAPVPERKGRSEFLLLQRNELLIARYYYYAKILGYQYKTTLNLISNELFLTERTVQDILQKNWDMVKHFDKSKTDVRVFKRKFQHIVW